MQIAVASACRQSYGADRRVLFGNSNQRALRNRLVRVLQAERRGFRERSGLRRDQNVRVRRALPVRPQWSYCFLSCARRSHKIFHCRWIFLSWFCFHATANIHGVWSDRAYGFADVGWSQPAGQKNAADAFGAARNVPAKGFSATTSPATIETIKQKCAGVLVATEFGRGKRFAHPNRFNDRQCSLEACDSFRGFLTVQLNMA